MNSRRFNNKGFTLVELLAVIAILSIVMSVVMYFAIDTVRTAKNKSYQVTVSNIENEATSYVLEQNKSFDWIIDDGGRTQHQCITVQDLIDTGYFKGDVLNSNVDEKNKVKADDYVYIERDSNTKTITKSIFKPNSVDLCYGYNNIPSGEETPAISFKGEISFNFIEGWKKEKDILITYQIITNDKFDNYTYDYLYEPNDGGQIINFNEKKFNNNKENASLKVNENGTITAIIRDKDGKEKVREVLDVKMIDNEPPVITCNKDTNVIKIRQNFDAGGYEYLTLLDSPIAGYAKGNYEITDYDKECTFFYYKYNKPANSDYPNYTDMFLVSDNSGIENVYEISHSLVKTDQDGNDRGTRKDNDGNCIWRATSCNCVYGYCIATYTYKVSDVAGNTAEKQFVFYHMYEDAISWRQNRCDANGEPIDKDKICIQ